MHEHDGGIAGEWRHLVKDRELNGGTGERLDPVHSC
jgi:hypothetical protein